jgi:hypothetical protein
LGLSPSGNNKRPSKRKDRHIATLRVGLPETCPILGQKRIAMLGIEPIQNRSQRGPFYPLQHWVVAFESVVVGGLPGDDVETAPMEFVRVPLRGLDMDSEGICESVAPPFARAELGQDGVDGQSWLAGA